MRDRFFFPLAAVLAGAFVLMALQPWADRPPAGPVSGGGRNAEDITIAGEELHRFVPGNYDSIAIVRPLGGGEPVLRITLMADEIYLAPMSGPHIVLDSDIEAAFESRPVMVEITARAPKDFGAQAFEVNYYARPEGESGWQRFPVTQDWQTYRYQFNVPKLADIDSAGYDHIGVRPVAPEKRSILELKSLRIHAVGPKKAG